MGSEMCIRDSKEAAHAESRYVFTCMNTDKICIFTDTGKLHTVKAEDIPLPTLDAVVAQAAVTYLKLCGFVLYFRLLAAGAETLLPKPWSVLPAMLLEVCSGCDCASRTGLWASTLCCAALSVQGASVLLQVRTICPPEVSLGPLLAARVLHLPLSLALFWLVMPGTEQALSLIHI